jgi:hypothetical protein
LKDKEAVEDKTVVVSVHTNVTAWMGEEFNFTLETPAPLQSITSSIVQVLRESEYDAGSHWSGSDVGCRCHLFSSNNLCQIQKVQCDKQY